MTPEPDHANDTNSTPGAGSGPVAPVGGVPAADQDTKDGLKAKVVQTGEAATERIGEQAKHVMRDAQDKTAQAKEKLSDLASRARENAPTVDPGVAKRSTGIGAAVLGISAGVVIWLLRRRARRNSNPWHAAARTAKAQVRTARRQAKSGLKTARKRSQARAVSQVAAARSKARDARKKAKNWR
jgi:cell division septum initiation protein DivIVA